MSLELLNRRDDEVLWRALARSTGVSEELARALWARAEREAGSDPIRTERAFRRMLEEAKELGSAAGELESGDGGLLDPGKWTRVLDVGRSEGVGPTSEIDASAIDPATRLRQAFEKVVSKSETVAETIANSNGDTIRDALKKFRNGNVGQTIASIDGGGLEQILRVADALISIAEHDRDVRQGKPLPANLRAELENKLGIDFSDVRVHDDAKAASEASSHGAIAFARGKNVYFADGAYDPSSTEGKHLIAHEVAHVAQQRGNAAAARGAMSEPGSAVEREADRVANAFVGGPGAGAAAFRIRESAGAGTISRKTEGPVAIKSWSPRLVGQALDLGKRLSEATDAPEGAEQKELKLGMHFGPLVIRRILFKSNEAGDKVERATIFTKLDSGLLKGTEGELSVDANEGVTGKLNIPINAPNMLSIEQVSVTVGAEEISFSTKLKPKFQSKHFSVKDTDVDVTVTSKGGALEVHVIGYTKVEIKTGFAGGEGELNLDLKANKTDGVSFNAHVKGQIQVAGLSKADATIFYNGQDLKMTAGGSVDFALPGLEGSANIKYELGKLSLDSENLRFTWPKLKPVNFKKVSLGAESKLKAEFSLNQPVSFKVGGSTITLEESDIKIDGTDVEGKITGSFALNNAGGFKAKTTIGYSKDGGFEGEVSVEGGASFKVGPADVTLENGSKLDIKKTKTGGWDVAGDIAGKAKLPAIGEIGIHVKAAKGKQIELEADATVKMDKIHTLLVGDLSVKYNRKGGKNEFALSATNVSANVKQIEGQPIFTEVKAHIAGKEVVGSMSIANGTLIKISPTTSLTLLGGTIELKPGGVLDGTVKAGGKKGESSAQAEFGWKDGNFLWAVEADFELSEFTNKILYGKVHAAGDSNGNGSFVSTGDVTFGHPKLKDIKITHVAGNKKENFYTATINARQAIDKAVAELPVLVETKQGDVTVTYKDEKLKFDAEVGGTVKYPKDGEPRVSGRFMVRVDPNGNFEAKISEVDVKAGELFESNNGTYDSTSGVIKPGAAKFKIEGIGGKINEATEVNIKTGKFHIDVDVEPKSGPLKGVKFKALVDNDNITAKIAENTPPMPLGKFAEMQLTDQSEIKIGKKTGLDAKLVGTVEAKKIGKGSFDIHYNNKTRSLKGKASIHADPIAMFDKIDVDLKIENKKVSTENDVILKLASKYEEHFAAEAKVRIRENQFEVDGHVKELKNLGPVSEAFKQGNGAKIEWKQGRGVKVEAGLAMDKVIPQLASGSILKFEYANNVFVIDGTLKPATYGPVVFTSDSHITAHWTSDTKKLDVHGHAEADIANLCKAKMTVLANKGGGEPGSFYLNGSIDATELSKKVPGVKFSYVGAIFGIQIGGPANAKPEMNFNLTAMTTDIAGYKVNGILSAGYKTGQGFDGKLQVIRAELGPVIADGFIEVEKNKFKAGHLHMAADFPSLKIDGTADVKPGEMDGLDTKVQLKVTPTADSAVAKFVQSGEINVDIKKWKVTTAEGILNLVPPSFLPLVDPKIVVKYTPEDGVSALLKTQFPAPMAKNGELGNFVAGYEKTRGLYAHVDFPITVPGFKAATVTGDLDKDGVKIGVDLFPKNDGLVKQARVEVGYEKAGGFYVEGKIRLKPTESLELELGLRYDGNGLQVIGITPDDKEAEKNEEHEVAKFKKSISIPLATVGVASLSLKFGMEVGAGYRMPKIKFKNPKLEGGLDALDSGGMPSFTFGGSIAMGAYVSFALSVQIAGEIELLIASASAGIGAEIMARLNLEMGADVDGRYKSGEGALITIDPFVGASLELIASLIATLYAEVGWWTIVDKKWTLASATLATIDLGRFQPFQPLGLAFGGPGGTRLTRGLSLREDAFGNVQKGVEEGGSKAADNESNREAREKITPVLQAFKNAAPQFQELPEGWEKGMVAEPVSFDDMFPVEEKKWDFYMDHADQAEDMVPELRMTTPTEKLAKAVAVTAKRDPRGAGRLILGWRRAQIAAKGVNPDTGVNVIEERIVVQALIEEKYQKDLAAAQEQQKQQDADHAAQVQKQGSDFAKADTGHKQAAQQQKVAYDQNVNKIQNEWDKAQEKKAEAGKVAAQEGAEVKPVAQEKAPPPPKPAPPPPVKPLAKPAPIPVPPPVPLPPPAEILPAVTLPALPADPGVSVKAAGVIPPSKKKAEPQSPGKKDAPAGGTPNPTPGATTNNAAQSAGAGGSPLPQGEGNQGGAAKAGGSTTATPPPGPKVAAGPDGIISQNKTIDTKHTQYDPAFKGAGKPGLLGALGSKDGPVSATPKGPVAAPGAPGAAPPGGAGAKDQKPGPPGAAGGADAGKGGPAKPGAGPLDPTVQKVVDQGKADQDQQKKQLDSQKQKYDTQVKQKNQQTVEETKKLDAAAAEAKKKKEDEKAAAAAAAPAPGAEPKPGDDKDKDKQPKGPIGVKISLDILGESHTLYIDETTGLAMVASTPTPVSTKISEASSAINKAPESVKQPASENVQAAKSAATKLDATAKKAFAGDESAKSAVAGDEQALSNPLKVTWSWLKVALDPAVTSGSIEKPLDHPYYTTFKGRVAQLASTSHISVVDPTQFAEAIWTKICDAVKKASPQMNDAATYSNFAKLWIDMKSPGFQTAIKEFEAIGKELAKVGTSAFSKAANFGFWSKDEGRSLAEATSGLTLETSSVGTMMDGLPTLDGKKNGGWDPEIWGALSNAYATAVVPEVVKGKKINVCVGAGVPAGNIWESVESVALERGLKQAGISLENVTTHYAAAPKSKKNRRELDETKQTGGHKGCVFVGDRAGALAAAEANFKTVPEEVAAPAAPGSSEVGARVPMTVGDKAHTQFIDPATAKPMVASTPTPVTNKLTELNSKLALMPAADPKKAEAQSEISKAQGLESTVADVAKKVKQGNDQNPKPSDHATNVAKLETDQKSLATSVAKIWTIADPAPLDATTAKQAVDAIAADCADISEPLAKEYIGKQRAELESKYIDKVVARRDIIAKYLPSAGDSKTGTQKVGSKDPIAVQKFHDVDAEKHIDPAKGGDGKKKDFYDALQAKMIGEATYNDRAATFQLFEKTVGHAYNFLGVKIPTDRISKAATRNHSVDNLYKSAKGDLIDKAIEDKLPPAMPAPEKAKQKQNDAMRKKAYRHLLVGKDAAAIKATFDSSGNITDYPTWYGPGAITVDTSTPPNAEFAKMMTLGALQPEWYANGTVVLNIQHKADAATRECRKPTAFDGLMSSLWTARNLKEADYGITGGGLGEFLEAKVPWADVQEMKPVIPTDDFLEEVKRLSDEAAKLNSTPTAELVKGNTAPELQPKGEAKDAYGKIIDKSTQEQNNPSPTQPTAPGAVKENADPALKPAEPAAAPGGAYDLNNGPRKDPTKSRHAVGDAPPDWSGRVVDKMASDAVAPDDPGHTYHLLNDGSGVSTTTPQKLAPAQTEIVKAKSKVPLTEQTPEQTLSSKEFETFSQNYANLLAGMKMPADPSAAKAIWLKMVETLAKTDAAYKAAPTAPNSPRKDLSSDAFQKIMAEFNPILGVLRPLMQKFSEGKKIWAFWSGKPAMEVAKANSEVCLEKSLLGGLFDGINVNGNWDTQMWASLSRAYAEFAAQDAENKTYRGFVGQGSSAEQSIFNKIEQPQFVTMLDKKAAANLKLTWYACAVNPADPKVLDATCSAGGMSGCFGTGDRASMVAMAEDMNKKRLDFYAKTQKVVAPAQVDAELAKHQQEQANAAAAPPQPAPGQQAPAAPGPQAAAPPAAAPAPQAPAAGAQPAAAALASAPAGPQPAAPQPAGPQPAALQPAAPQPAAPAPQAAAAPADPTPAQQPAAAAPTGATPAEPGAAGAAPAAAAPTKEEEPAKPLPVHLETPFTGTHSHKITTEAKEGAAPKTIIQSDPLPAGVLLDKIASFAKDLLDSGVAGSIPGRVKTAKGLHEAVLVAAEAAKGGNSAQEKLDRQAALKQAQDALGAEVGALLKLYEEQGLLVASAVGFKATGEALRLIVHKAVEDMTKLDAVQKKLEEITSAPAHGLVPVTPGAGMIALGKGIADRPDVAAGDRINYKMPDDQITQERRGGKPGKETKENKLGQTVVINAERSNKEVAPGAKQPFGVDTYEQVLTHVANIVELLRALPGWNDPALGGVSETTVASIMRTYAKTGIYPQDLPSSHRARINELTLLLFGREAARDHGVTAFTPMALELIASGASTFKDQLNKDDMNMGGGTHPTSFKGSENKPENSTAKKGPGPGPVAAAQADKEIRAGGTLPELTPAKEAARQRAVDELVKRETALAEAYLKQVAPTAWGFAVFENEACAQQFIVKKMLAFYGVKGEKLAEKVQAPPPQAPPAAPPPPPTAQQQPAPQASPAQEPAAAQEPPQQQPAQTAAAPKQPMPPLLPLTPEASPKETKPQASAAASAGSAQPAPQENAPASQQNPPAPTAQPAEQQPQQNPEDEGRVEPPPIIKTQAVAWLQNGIKRLFGKKNQQPKDPVKDGAGAAKDATAANDAGTADKEKQAASGLASRIAMDPFVAAAKSVAGRWAELVTPEARINALVAAANAQLQAAGVPACAPVPSDLPPAVKGRFDWTPWIIEMSKPLFSDSQAATAIVVDDPAKAHAERMADVSSIVYHEARHAEQLFNVARLLAGKKKSAEDIKRTMNITNDAVVAQAVASALGSNDPASAAAETHFDSIFGKNSEARDAVLKRLEVTVAALMQAKEHAELCRKSNEPAQIRAAANTAETKAKQAQRDAEADYKALPEEADAFAVQKEIRDLFLFPG